jgi:hypothetical protein
LIGLARADIAIGSTPTRKRALSFVSPPGVNLREYRYFAADFALQSPLGLLASLDNTARGVHTLFAGLAARRKWLWMLAGGCGCRTQKGTETYQ